MDNIIFRYAQWAKKWENSAKKLWVSRFLHSADFDLTWFYEKSNSLHYGGMSFLGEAQIFPPFSYQNHKKNPFCKPLNLGEA